MNYKKMIPADSPIGRYLDYMEAVETARSYDFWCAIWALGSACGRQVYVDRPRIPVFLNWYVILCAESGITRKSTAVIAARKWLVGADPSHPTIEGKTNAPSLIQLLGERTLDHGRADAALVVSELATVLGKGSESVGLPILLTDLYDCEQSKSLPSTIRDGAVALRDVFVTFLSASTPTWLATAVSPQVIEGGFTSRVMFITDETRKRSIHWPRPEDDDSWDQCVQSLVRCVDQARSVSRIRLNPSAVTALGSWYRNRPINRTPFLSSFDAREDDHALRLAACLSINDGTYEIQKRHIVFAVQAITEVKTKANDLFGGNYNESVRMGDGIDKIRQVLIEAGMDGMSHNDLYYRCRYRISAIEFNTLMTVMHECNMVQVFITKDNPNSKKQGKRHYRGTQKITALGMTTELLARVNLPRGSV